MGATNTTTYYNLSQFIGTDKPAWLQDYNGDMLKIDTGINAAKLAADAAALDAGAAQNTADGAVSSITTLSSTVGVHTTAITNLSGAVNTINSLIGNGTPTTTDQTIIGAINEINANLGSAESLLNTQIGYYGAPSNLAGIIPWYDNGSNSFGFVLTINSNTKFEIRFDNNAKKLYTRYYDGNNWQTLATYTGA